MVSGQDIREADCAIIGGGPGGLTAATYLGRFQRSAVVFDDGRSRLQEIPRSRNVPGFPDGIEGPVLLGRMQEQARHYGARTIEERVESIERTGDAFLVRTKTGEITARSVILATGVEVTPPPVERLQAAVASGVVRYCPICDGFEARDRRIAVLAGRPASIEEAIFLADYSKDVTLLPAKGGLHFSAEQLASARDLGIRIETRIASELSATAKDISAKFADGADTFDILYPCLGSRPRSELAVALGADVSPSGGLMVDSRQQTNIPMLYAAGDVLEGLDQIASACGQAAIAATTIHNHLRRRA